MTAQELQAIIENTYDGLYITDGEANTLMINHAYERITGIKREEVLGKNMRELVASGVFDRSASLEVLEKKRPVTIMQELRGGKKVLVTGSPVFDKDNANIILIITNVRDITELMELKEELHERTLEVNRYIAELDKIKILQIQQNKFATKSKVMIEILEKAIKAAQFDSNILITGESGVGKGLVSRLIHDSSSRKEGPFVVINCASIPEDLFESELFGYVEGAFTGAKKGGKKGMFEEANKGTIFLDEISEINLNTQVKLLRVLQEKEINRVGSPISIPVDVRIIAATNTNLEQAVRNGKFREDLYYRLNMFPINIPSLKQRKDDIPLLANEFIKKFNYEYGRNIRGIEEQAVQKLMEYDWPGNVRELENYIGRCIINTSFSEQIIKKSNLPQQNMKAEVAYSSKELSHEEIEDLDNYIAKIEAEYLRNVLNSLDNNKTEAAKKLGISIRSLYYKLDKYGINYDLS